VAAEANRWQGITSDRVEAAQPSEGIPKDSILVFPDHAGTHGRVNSFCRNRPERLWSRPVSAGRRASEIRQEVMSSSPTVLVYDDAIETSEVLKAVYQPRGFEVHRQPSPGQCRHGQTFGNSVVVLRSLFNKPSEKTEAPLKVLIGRFEGESLPHDESRVAACRLSSLFDYRELVSAIDRLLCGSD
jgi:hypothetical protein